MKGDNPVRSSLHNMKKDNLSGTQGLKEMLGDFSNASKRFALIDNRYR